MSTVDLLVICRPAGDPVAVQSSLESAAWGIQTDKRVQGFGQAPGLLSGTNHVFVVKINKHCSPQEALEHLRDWLKTSADDHVYVPETLVEHEATLTKLLPPTPTETRGNSPVQPVRVESDRKFTFDENQSATTTPPLTRSAVEALPEALDEQLIHHDSLSRTTTQSLSVSEQSETKSATVLSAAPTQPRLSKTAALRMGLPVPEPISRRTSNVSADTRSSSDSGAKSTPTTSVKSLQSPSVQPRPTRASALRANGGNATTTSPRPSTSRQASGTSSRSSTGGNYPGYKRQSLDIRVASVQNPSFAPRTNRAAALRAGTWTEEDEAALKAEREQRRLQSSGSTANTPGYKRASLQLDVKSTRQPTVAPKMSKAAALRMGISSSQGTTPQKKAETPLASKTNKRASLNVASLNQPAVSPRPNRAAELRANGGGVASPSLKGTSPVQRTATPKSAPPAARPAVTKGAEASPTQARKKAVNPAAPPPSIAPRGNRSAQLRAAKKASV